MSGFLLDKVLESFPDLADVIEIVVESKAQHKEAWAGQAPSKRALPLLAIVLAKQQAKEEELRGEIGSHLDEEKCKEVQGVVNRYWNHLHTVGITLRKNVNGSSKESLPVIMEENKATLAEDLALDNDDICFAWVSECEEDDSSTHCPDFALTIDREQQCLVLTLLGTRITPAPNMHDIIMDLRAGSQPFMGGEAHAGMAIGAENILAKVEEHLKSALAREPNFSLLVIGYSLGAGLAQLVTARLLEGPETELVDGTKVRCLAFGAPPVFRGELRPFPEITVVQNAMDGIIGASIKTIMDLFNKLVAINATGISRRNLLAMVLSATSSVSADETVDGQEEAASIEDIGEILDKEEEEEDQDDTDSVSQSFTGFLSSVRSRVSKHLPGGDDDWERVEEAVKGRPREESGDWEVLGTNLLQMFVEADAVRAKLYHGSSSISHLTSELHLHPAMYSDHMPWGYQTLADKCATGGDLSCLDQF